MGMNNRQLIRLCWFLAGCLIVVPVVIAALNPLQMSRGTSYVVGGLAGVVALSLFLVQPLLAAGFLPGMTLSRQRQWHRWVGASIITLIAMHVVGLYVTSPADIRDALLLQAPTSFSVYGVIALWASALTVLLVVLRGRMIRRGQVWKLSHQIVAAITIAASVIHALQIQGAMGNSSKWVISVAVLCVTAYVILTPLINGWRRK